MRILVDHGRRHESLEDEISLRLLVCDVSPFYSSVVTERSVVGEGWDQKRTEWVFD